MQTNNIINLIGRLTADPELKTTSSGIEVVSGTIAVDRRHVKQGEEKQTDFIPFVAWRQTGVFLNKYFKKGQAIQIFGSLQSRKYDDKDGNKRTSYEVNVDAVDFVGSKRDNNDGQHSSDNTAAASVDIADDEDLPF